MIFVLTLLSISLLFFLPGFDLELKTLLPTLAKNSSLKRLAIGRNFGGIKLK